MIARGRGIDAVSVVEIGRRGRSDEEQLLWAAAEGRAFVTRDYGDFDILTQRFWAEGLAHAGVLLVPRSLPTTDYAGVVAAVERYDREHPDGMPAYLVDYLRRV